MPTCIAGMHRSGTSLIARVLQQAGLYLGPESDLLGAGPGNPDGHFENTRFIAINDAVLELAGGNWANPPRFDSGWHLERKYEPLVDRAAQLVDSFAGREPWGWKDPRNSLTLPFWQRLLPHLKVVVALRNPLEVAASLLARNELPVPAGVLMWAQYSAPVLAATQREDRLVTHYESYFIDFREELVRLLRFAGLSTDAIDVEALRGHAKSDLRHNRSPLRELLGGWVERDTVRLYLDLCAEAGPVFGHDYAAAVFEAATGKAADGDSPIELLGRAAVFSSEQDRIAAGLRHEIEVKKAELEISRHETAAARRQVAELLDKLSWRRHQWADWLADLTYTIRHGKRRP